MAIPSSKASCDLKWLALTQYVVASPCQFVRERFGFTAELRAVGAAVKRDLILALARCGFDTFEVAAGEDLAACAQALHRYSVAYQRAPGPIILRQRFSA